MRLVSFSGTLVAYLYCVLESTDQKMNDLRHNSCPWISHTYKSNVNIWTYYFVLASLLPSGCIPIVCRLLKFLQLVQICSLPATTLTHHGHQKHLTDHCKELLPEEQPWLVYFSYVLFQGYHKDSFSSGSWWDQNIGSAKVVTEEISGGSILPCAHNSCWAAMAPVKISHVVSFSSQVY